MALIKSKPTSPGRRFQVKISRSHLHKGGPEESLVVHKNSTGARNLPYVDVLPVSSLDPLSLARHDHVLATAGAVRLIEERLA